MGYAFIERVGIMADSGLHDIAQAFGDTEKARILIEAQHCIDWYGLEERREFLRQVELWRGQAGLELMKAAMTEAWNRSKQK